MFKRIDKQMRFTDAERDGKFNRQLPLLADIAEKNQISSLFTEVSARKRKTNGGVEESKLQLDKKFNDPTN